MWYYITCDRYNTNYFGVPINEDYSEPIETEVYYIIQCISSVWVFTTKGSNYSYIPGNTSNTHNIIMWL